MKVQVLKKTVINGSWLNIGDIYTGRKDDLQIFLDEGFVTTDIVEPDKEPAGGPVDGPGKEPAEA